MQKSASISNLSLILGADRLPVDRADRRIAHFREARRDSCNIPCDVVVTLDNGLNFDSGTARIANVSPHGALLTHFNVNRGSLPLAPYALTLLLQGDQYRGIRIEATTVRIVAGGFSLGVSFNDLAVDLG
jgi:hypothetical protein